MHDEINDSGGFSFPYSGTYSVCSGAPEGAMTHNEIKSLLLEETMCGHACVEVAQHGEVVHMRDSKDPDGPMLTFTGEQWASFKAAVAAGEFDRD